MTERKRYFIVLDIDTDGDKDDVAIYIDSRLGRAAESTVYDSLDDMVADRKEKVGPFSEPPIGFIDGILP